MKTNPSLGRFKPAVAAALATIIAWGLSARSAQAVPYVVTLQQVGANVVATGSGAIDLTGLSVTSNNGTASTFALMQPSTASLHTGPTASTVVDIYTGFSGPTSFGGSVITFASSGSGDLVGINGAGIDLEVPHLYVSGNTLLDTSTYNNATFASLGVTPGIYVWTWGTGPDQKFTLDAIAPAVPETGSTFGLLFLAFTALFGANRLRSFRLA